jgi:hypothetical protein
MPTLSRAQIINGVWVRNVTWVSNGIWRTDIFKSVLDDPRLKIAEFHLVNGPTVLIPKEELERVLVGGKEHYSKKIWGPFNIDPQRQKINDTKVVMTIIE